MQVTIAGSGGWGTALAILLHENGHDVTLWSHFETESKQLAETHQNPYLPGVTLPEGLHYSADPACAQGKEMVVFATPSFAVRTTARAFAPYLAETPLLVSVTKGIEEGTGYRMSELVSQETGRTVVALSGPSHAEEVSRGIPTGVVVACPERELAERVQNAFMCSRFRVYTSPDTAGIELGAALKNVIALCAGVCDGMGYGDNTKALLMTRGLAEVARLGMALGAHRETFAGLAGVGDLIVTCTSMHSRNRRAGILIGQMTSNAAIAGIGDSLGRGTILTIIIVMFILPQILLLGEKVIDKTAFDMPSAVSSHQSAGRVRIDGMVRGEIHGQISGIVHAVVEGDVNISLLSGTAEPETADAPQAQTEKEDDAHE